MAEPGPPLSVARVILESESRVISETECSEILSSPVDSDPLILSCVTPDSIQSTASTSQLALSKPHLSQRYFNNYSMWYCLYTMLLNSYHINNIYTGSVINLENLKKEYKSR